MKIWKCLFAEAATCEVLVMVRLRTMFRVMVGLGFDQAFSRHGTAFDL